MSPTLDVSDFEPDRVIDGADCILGRVASHVAESALAGERIAVVNAESMIVTGRRNEVLDTYRTRVELHSDRGPHYPKRPDRLVKRSIRGMLPHKTTRGREALGNVRVYLGNPFEDAFETEVLEDTTLDRLSNIRFVSMGEISEKLGAKVTW